ncbi:recombinase family protein [Anaerotruncus rubiinfantis]|uniref:recombinase family protein n=1 Tax=Anaerotruncus rubiinfantis TaxID=1720200 RepID=UPI00189C1C11|nr:recombinase family protein [Anaerotruncus rubiinfantis]
MIDQSKKQKLAEQKARVHRRVYAEVDPNNYEFIPAKKQIDYYDNDVPQRVAVYARVSTDNIQQTSSYELQKKYYEEFVVHHPNWTLVKIYADEGISGTSLAHRDEFNRMISDCRAGKIDMIITKSVSRFARNVVDCISMVRTLAELTHPVGVFFESECIFSLKDDSQMALSFQATMAQEESHIRSRSMETSLRMRLDGGLPLTPKLLGYSHDADGKLVINPDEQSTVKLIFFMYLYGYSTTEIAEALTELGRKTYLGNVTWTSNSIVQVLRNERHCGEVLTRKTFTPNYLNHKSRKNKGDRPQSVYRNHHEAIVSRDDYIAVQHLLNNAKYGSKSILPELRVIDSGLLRGYVTINPRWAGFKAPDYFQAAANLKPSDGAEDTEGYIEEEPEIHVAVEAGDFDMRGFEITRSEFFDSHRRPYAVFQDKQIKFSTDCVRKLGKNNMVEFLVNPREMKFAVRTAAKDSRHAVACSRVSNGIYYPKTISCAAYMDTLYQIFGWNSDFKYRVTGTLFQKENEAVYLFNMNDAEVFIKPYLMAGAAESDAPKDEIKPLSVSGTRVRAVPREWMSSFGNQYYLHQHIFPPVESQSENDWKIRLEGQLFETGEKIHVTGFDELKCFITQELSRGELEEKTNE